jgi:RimJ/RimL family protein N-acetyltransferase
LRPLIESDTLNLLPFALHEPEIWQFSLVQAVGEEGLHTYILQAIAQRENEKEYPFIVYDKQTERYVGSTRFYDIQFAQKNTQLGYTWYGKEAQGTGLNQEVKQLLLQFAFEEMNMERVEFRADARNQRSIAALKKIGCTLEGTLRSNGICPDGTRRDSIVCSILRDEWQKNTLLTKT